MPLQILCQEVHPCREYNIHLFLSSQVSQSENTVNLGNPGTGYLENFALLHEVKYVSASAKEAANAVLDLSRYDGYADGARHVVHISDQRGVVQVVAAAGPR